MLGYLASKALITLCSKAPVSSVSCHQLMVTFPLDDGLLLCAHAGTASAATIARAHQYFFLIGPRLRVCRHDRRHLTPRCSPPALEHPPIRRRLLSAAGLQADQLACRPISCALW